MAKKVKKAKSTKSKPKAGGALSSVVKGASSLLGGKKGGGGGGRRRKGPAYWQNRALAEKYKRKYLKLKFGGV